MAISVSTAGNQAPRVSWRDVLPIHPAAELFEPLGADELRALSEDIRKHGLTHPVVLWAEGYNGDNQTNRTWYVLDGINRLDALEIAGIETISGPGHGPLAGKPQVPIETFGARFLKLYEKKETHSFPSMKKSIEKDVDPYAYVISANIHRRHLTTEQKRDLITKLIKADPNKSDRQIAETVKASPTTVRTVRHEMEAKGDVSNLDTRRDSKGVSSPHVSVQRRGNRPIRRRQFQTRSFSKGPPSLNGFARCLAHRGKTSAAIARPVCRRGSMSCRPRPASARSGSSDSRAKLRSGKASLRSCRRRRVQCSSNSQPPRPRTKNLKRSTGSAM